MKSIQLFTVLFTCFVVFISSYPTQKIPINTKPHDPFFLDFHMTRIFGGCFHDNEKKYNTIVPWVRNFDLIITKCGLDWAGHHSGGDPCAWVFDNNDPIQVSVVVIELWSLSGKVCWEVFCVCCCENQLCRLNCRF